MANHKRAHICKALRINDQTLKQWASQLAPAEHVGLDEYPPSDSHAAGRFVELGSPTMHPADVMNAKAVTTVRIELVNGAVISTDQLFSLEQIFVAACTSLESGA